MSDTCNISKDDDLDLGDDVEAFSGSQADLQGAAENLCSSPPRPQPLRFESLSLKTPKTLPPTPGTALQNKIESKLEKSLGNQFNIQLQQQMGIFQASMLEAMRGNTISEQPERVCSSRAKKHLDKKKHKVWAKYFSQSSSSEEDQSSVPVKRSAKPQRAPEQDQQQINPDPVFYREVDMSDLLSQYAEEVETFRHILDLPDPRETMPRSSTTVLGLDDEKGKQELRSRWLFSYAPFKSISQICL